MTAKPFLCVEDGAELIEIEPPQLKQKRTRYADLVNTGNRLNKMCRELQMMQRKHSQISVALSNLIIAREALYEDAKRLRNQVIDREGKCWICPECGGYWQP